MTPLLLRLLQPSSFTRHLEIRDSDLIELKPIVHSHNLLMLIYSQLKRYVQATGTVSDIGHFLRQTKPLYLNSVIHSVQQEAVEKEIVILLKKNNIHAVIIKGNEIAREIYNDPNCRTSSDIDILVKKQDVVSANAILEKAGYQADKKTPLRYCLYRIHHAEFFHPKTKQHVELHWLFGVPAFFHLTSEDLWLGVQQTDAGELKLSPEMLLIMLLIHHHSHSFRELKILVDILWAVHKYNDLIDWYEFAGRLKATGLAKTALITLNQLEDLWKEAVGEITAVQVLRQAIKEMGYRKPGFLISYFRMNLNDEGPSRIYKDKLIARLALDKWSTALLSYFRTLFPPREAIRGLYGVGKKWTLPLDYLRFIRWRVKDWTHYN